MMALRRHGYAMLGGLFAVAIVVYPFTEANDYVLRLVLLFLIYAVVAFGLNVLVGLSGLVSLGQAGLYAIGAYTAAILATEHGVGFLPCLIAGTVLAGVFGVVLAYPTVRVRGVYLAVVTIAFGLIILNVAIEWESFTGAWVGISDIPAPTVIGIELSDRGYFVLIGLITLCCLFLNLSIIRSRLGRAMRAVAASDVAAQSVGINAVYIRTLAFTISAMMAGAAGVFYVFLNKYVSPDIFSFRDSIRFLLMVILGGAGTPLGPLVGAGILTWLPEALQDFGEWQYFVYGLLLAVVMFILPRGIVGTAEHILKRRGEPKMPPEPARGARPKLGDVLTIPPGNGEAALVVEGITVAFGGLLAVDQVSERVRRGDIHALIGPNGAGKSTLLNAISGIYPVATGRITLQGVDVTRRKSFHLARRGVARTFQNTELFGEMTVLDNVLVGFDRSFRATLVETLLSLPRYRREEARYAALARDLLAYVGLDAYAAEKAKSLPFGFQRRLEIARALAISPRLLLLDEPAAGLTHQEIEELIALIRDLRDAGITIILVEHHVDLIMEVSDHVTVLDYGKCIASGTTSAVRDNPAVIEAYFGTALADADQAAQ